MNFDKEPKMTNRKEKLLEDIECEGFDYALNHYDDYHDVDDPIFIELYDEYLSSRKALVDHLGISA